MEKKFDNVEKEKFVLLTGLDYVGSEVVAALFSLGFSKGLCVVIGSDQSANELVRKTQELGYSSLVSTDLTFVRQVIRGFGATICVTVGSIDKELPLGSEWNIHLDVVHHLPDDVRVPIKQLATRPPWPEFMSIWDGAEASGLSAVISRRFRFSPGRQVLTSSDYHNGCYRNENEAPEASGLNPMNLDNSTTNENNDTNVITVHNDTNENILITVHNDTNVIDKLYSPPVEITSLDTAISLRFKHVGLVRALAERALKKLIAFISEDIHSAARTLCEEGNENYHDEKNDAPENHYLIPYDENNDARENPSSLHNENNNHDLLYNENDDSEQNNEKYHNENNEARTLSYPENKKLLSENDYSNNYSKLVMASENASSSEHKNDASSNINWSENKSLARESAPVKTCWYIEPTFSLLEADRFIRASQFPPYEAAILKSELDGKEYFVDHTDQYINYCEECFGARIRDNNVSPENSENNTQQIQQLNKKAYSLDTHWYSNVGGTFMKVSAEMAGMREKKKDGAAAESVVPGQALLKSAKKRLRMNEPLIGLSAKTYVDRALSSGWIGVEGPFIKKFEANLARICGVQAACAVQSGTAALYGAMKGLGVSDKLHHVVVPTYTCAACADAVVHAGGIPIPVDCELESYGLSFEAVERVIREDDQVVGVVIAPCYGVPARDHGAIYKLCKERGIWLCEDNCESYGASMRFDDKGVSKWLPVGSLSTMSVVSVRSEKMVGVGEGGAILSKDAALVSKARWWCSRAPVRGCGMWRVYEHEEVGQNYRLPEILGAVGLAACENLPVMIHNKRRIHQWYLKYLSGTAVEFQQEQEGEQPVWWLNSLLVNFERLGKRNDGRVDNMAEKLGMRLMEAYPHIEIRPAFFPLHLIASFKEHANYPCPNAEYLYSSLFCAPSSAMLCEEDVKEICEAVRWGLETV